MGMTDWSVLQHAYGTAEDIPALLDRAAADDQEAWSELWSALCHQGTSYTASYAALPRLAEMANVDAVLLAAGIVADGGAEVLAAHAPAVTTLLGTANAALPNAGDDFVYVLEAVLVLEGLHDQADVLAWGVTNEEYEIECPQCGTSMYIAIDEGVSRTEDAERPLRPSDPSTLDGIGRRVCDTAAAHGQDKAARVFRYFFGQATCPACDAELTVSDELL